MRKNSVLPPNLPNMPNRRNTRNSGKRRNNSRAMVNVERQTLNAVRELTSVTRDFALPRRRDIIPPVVVTRGKVYRFVRSAFYNTITSSSSIQYGSGNFKLSDLPNYTDFTALFDKYRFVCVIVKFIPSSTLGDVNSTSVLTGDNPLVYTVIDYDDSQAPLSVDELRQFDTAQVNPVGKYFQRVFCPRAALAAYSGTFTSYSTAPQRMWFDCNSPNVQFYALKWASTPFTTGTGTAAMFQMEVDYIMEFKDPR